MRVPRQIFLIVLSAFLMGAPPGAGYLAAQEEGRIWGRVTTATGETHEGFIRWDRNEGSWVDLLNGSKDQEAVLFQDWWKLAHPGDPHRDRVIEVAGYRITWDDEELEWPTTAESGIRFGHIRRIELVEDDRVRLELQSGLEAELEGGATDLGSDLREITIEKPDGSVVELEWEEFESLEPMPSPAGRRALGDRLHGTAEDREGNEYTGFLSFGPDLILTVDTLRGEEDEESRGIPFGEIESLERIPGETRVTLVGGGRVDLSGGETLGREHRRILVSDPNLGMVEMPWRDLASIRLHPPESLVGYDAFAGSHRLRGTVETREGEEITGWILWDGDEAFSWELLDGTRDDVVFDVEFGEIASIERAVQITVGLTVGPEGANAGRTDREHARVTLMDGRVLELDGSNDVDASNKGIFILRDGDGSPDDPETEWIRVGWGDFKSVRFDHGGGR